MTQAQLDSLREKIKALIGIGYAKFEGRAEPQSNYKKIRCLLR
jgi:hypothetical protein